MVGVGVGFTNHTRYGNRGYSLNCAPSCFSNCCKIRSRWRRTCLSVSVLSGAWKLRAKASDFLPAGNEPPRYSSNGRTDTTRGVAASAALRVGLQEALGAGAELYYPSLRLATDNGAMIARTAQFRFQQGEVAGLDFTARADLRFPGLVRATA